MIKVFISYAIEDKTQAKIIYNSLSQKKIKPFLADSSINLGTTGRDTVFKEIRRSIYIFFLASRASCSSQFVQQTLGAAISINKKIVPILIDIEKEDLPGWTTGYQAIYYDKESEALWKFIDNIEWELNL